MICDQYGYFLIKISYNIYNIYFINSCGVCKRGYFNTVYYTSMVYSVIPRKFKQYIKLVKTLITNMCHQYHCNNFVAPTHCCHQYIQVEQHCNPIQTLKLYGESRPGLWVPCIAKYGYHQLGIFHHTGHDIFIFVTII